MKDKEIIQILLAIIVFAIVSSFSLILNFEYFKVGAIFLFSFIIISINILSKKFIAYQLDSNVEHSLWQFQRYGLRPKDHLKKSISAGLIFPIITTVITVGTIKLLTFLTFETKALKKRAARRFGNFSFTEMTDFHNAIVGASGIISVILVSFISYFIPGAGELSKLAAYFAFWNMIPFSKLDGSQIFFGSKVLWSTLAIITLIFTSYALFLI